MLGACPPVGLASGACPPAGLASDVCPPAGPGSGSPGVAVANIAVSADVVVVVLVPVTPGTGADMLATLRVSKFSKGSVTTLRAYAHRKARGAKIPPMDGLFTD